MSLVNAPQLCRQPAQRLKRCRQGIPVTVPKSDLLFLSGVSLVISTQSIRIAVQERPRLTGLSWTFCFGTVLEFYVYVPITPPSVRVMTRTAERGRPPGPPNWLLGHSLNSVGLADFASSPGC